jgi:hypothetical protein
MAKSVSRRYAAASEREHRKFLRLITNWQHFPLQIDSLAKFLNIVRVLPAQQSANSMPSRNRSNTNAQIQCNHHELHRKNGLSLWENSEHKRRFGER